MMVEGDKRSVKVEVEVYHTPECPADIVIEEIRTAFSEVGISKYDLEEIVLASDEEAKKYRVLGVPTVRINGTDVDPNFKDEGVYKSTCSRIYRWEGKFHEYPPKEMIEDALRRIGII